MSIGHYLMHDMELIKAHMSQSTRLLVASTWLRAAEYFPTSFSANDDFKQFQASLDTKSGADVI